MVSSSARPRAQARVFRSSGAWSLSKGPSAPHIAVDFADWLDVLIDATRSGATLLIPVHLRPHYTFAEKKQVQTAFRKLITVLRPQATPMAGLLWVALKACFLSS